MGNFLKNYTALTSSQKAKSAGTPLYTREVNRRIARFIAAALAATPITPNVVSGLTLLCTVVALGCFLLLEPSFPVSLWVTLLLLLGYALDSADGQLARLKGLQSIQGEWLDHVIDCFKLSAIHWSVFIYFSQRVNVDEVISALLVFLFQSSSLTLYFSGGLKSKISKDSSMDRKNINPYGIYNAIITPLDYGVLCIAFIFSVNPSIFIYVYASLCFMNVILVITILLRTYLQLGQQRG